MYWIEDLRENERTLAITQKELGGLMYVAVAAEAYTKKAVEAVKKGLIEDRTVAEDLMAMAPEILRISAEIKSKYREHA